MLIAVLTSRGFPVQGRWALGLFLCLWTISDLGSHPKPGPGVWVSLSVPRGRGWPGRLCDLASLQGSKAEHPGQACPPGNFLLPVWALVQPYSVVQTGHFLSFTDASTETELEQDQPLQAPVVLHLWCLSLLVISYSLMQSVTFFGQIILCFIFSNFIEV